MIKKHCIFSFLSRANFDILLGIILLCLFFTSNITNANALDKNSSPSINISITLHEDSDYTITNHGKEVNITFNHPLAEQLSNLTNQYPRTFSAVEISADKKSAKLQLENNLNIKNYRQNNSLILNISSNIDAANNIYDKNNLASIRLKYNPTPQFSRFILEFGRLPKYEIKSANNQTNIIFETPFKIETNSLSKYDKHPEVKFQPAPSGKFILSFPEPLIQSFEQQSKIILDLGENQTAPTPEYFDDSEAQDITTQRSNTLYKDSKLAAPKTTIKQIRSLSFSWNNQVNIAVFKRNQYLWIVFDRNQTLNIPELSATAKGLAKDLVQIPNPQATILRLTPNDNVQTSIRSEGLLWIVDLYTDTTAPEVKEIPVFTQHDALNRSYLFLPTTNSGNIIAMFDPEIGDIMTIIPVSDINNGMKNSYTYPDIKFQQSQTGIVVILNSDDISINRGNTGISIRRENKSLNISEDLNELKRKESLNRIDDNDNNFFQAVPAEINSQNYTPAIETLENDIHSSSPETIDRARLLKASYFLSRGLGTNALNILQKMEKDKSPEVNKEKFHGMKGVANFLAHRYKEALDNFSYGNLPSFDEAVFWRSLISSAINPKPEDNAILMSYNHIFKNYPDEIRRRIAIIGIESAFLSRDDISIQNYIDLIRESKNNVNKTALINYYNARKLELIGYPLNAIREYRNASFSDSTKYSALSRRRMVDIQRKTKTIRPEKAIAEYEMLRYAWGEKNFKLSLLDELSNMYAENKDYYQALQTLSELSNLLDKNTDKAQITTRMVKLFENIYLNNEDSTIPALKSLALYEDYQWLAPLSPNYNAIVQKLADRLVAVDLLDRAYLLLGTQLQNKKLNSLEKSTIGTRMALINLFNQNPQNALDILERTDSDMLPPNILAHRRIIRAKALSALGQTDEALELLGDDYSKNGIMMKSEIYWNNKHWDKAADTIKYLIEKPKKDEKLSNEQLQLVLDWITALKKSGKNTVIVRIKNTFEPFFKDTAYYSVFNVLTDTIEDNKIDMKNIDETINNISAFSNFARIYSQSLQNSSLSQTIP